MSDEDDEHQGKGNNKEAGKDRDSRRDNRGRFQSGASGNPNGRPKKKVVNPEEVPTFEEELFKLVSETIELNQGGKEVHMPANEALARSFLKSVLEAKGPGKARLMESLAQMVDRGRMAAARRPAPFDWGEAQEKMFEQIKKMTGWKKPGSDSEEED